MRILVPTDGSQPSLNAVRHAAAMVAATKGAELHIVNVQPALPSAITTFVAAESVQSFHRDEAEKELAPAREAAKAAGVTPIVAVEVGKAADSILDYAKAHQCTQIVMGTRGLSTIPSLLLGSVAERVMHLAEIPVTLVK